MRSEVLHSRAWTGMEAKGFANGDQPPAFLDVILLLGVDKDPKVACFGSSTDDDIMSEDTVLHQIVQGHARINRAAARICTLLLAAAASFALTVSAYLEDLRPTRVGAVLAALIVLHLIWRRRFIWPREFTLYANFLGYMFIVLLWTHDVELAMNTLVPAINCMLAMIFFGSLIEYHSAPTALAGTLCGFLLGVMIYTITQGFPFSFPLDFSYNAIAGMYAFGLFVTLMYSCFRRSIGLLLVIAILILLHIIATTSIKTNLGIALGFVGASIMYSWHLGRLLRRRILILIVLVSTAGIAVASNDVLLGKLVDGVRRVSLGIEVLQARSDVAGYTGFEDRSYWKQVGMEGWRLNPVFGYGTEAFRDRYGITSHSTPVDVLYNYGLIGMVLFYGVFVSLMWRLLKLSNRQVSSQRALVLAGVVFYIFVSLSGTMHYNIFLAAFVGISAGLLDFRGGPSDSTRTLAIKR